MGNNTDLFKILASETFSSILNKDVIKVCELNALVSLLIECNVPFNLFFSQATHNDLACAKLTIVVSPTLTITLSFDF